jgi:predicted kinase
VRAKVACLRRAQGDPRAGDEARRLHGLCLRHLERARVRLVLVGGAPGTGKSTVAAALAERAGWTALRSDATRRSLLGPAGPPGDAAYGEGRYSPERRAQVYAALAEDARRRLALGESVILDASWSAARDRDRARAVAAATRSELVEIRCEAPAAVAGRRIGLRLAADADPWPEALPLDTDRALEATVADAGRLVA